ncbi:MAG: hypothetical protein O2967_06170 [Proteobacteria bacterium]|nr:hypothetical protein [Pseudomonadota bacterium]
MSNDNLDDAALEQLARQLGLGTLYDAQPALLRQAYDGGRAMARRLRRPADIADEPGHIFQPDNNV